MRFKPFKDRPCIVHLVNSLTEGGTERTLVALLRGFDPEPHRHLVITLREAGALAARLPGHVACRALGVQGRSRTSAIAVARRLRESRASVLHARNTGCWTDAVVAGLLRPSMAVVLGFHGLESDKPFSHRQRRVIRLALWSGACFTSVSEAGRRQLCEQGGVPGECVDVLKNGVDVERFAGRDAAARQAIRDELGLAHDAFVVGTVASLTPVKGHSAFLRAMAALDQPLLGVHLVVVGEGPLRTMLSQQAEALGIRHRVRFTGWREDVPRLLAAMDAYVSSSVSEGMSNAVLEAMAAGLPVVATDVSDHAILIRDGVEGHIVPCAFPAAIARAVAKLARHPERARQFGAAACTRARLFDFSRTLHEYAAYYEAIVAPLRGPRVRGQVASFAPTPC